MKKFDSVREAFDWWVKNVYPNLPPDQKRGRLTNAWRNYTFNLGISESKMLEILKEFGDIYVKTEVYYSPR